MIYPKGIKKGDTIGIVAPSGPFRATTLGEIENALNDLGYNVKFGESCYGSYKGYLSSEDSIRAKDIEDMFLDKTRTSSDKESSCRRIKNFMTE